LDHCWATLPCDLACLVPAIGEIETFYLSILEAAHPLDLMQTQLSATAVIHGAVDEGAAPLCTWVDDPREWVSATELGLAIAFADSRAFACIRETAREATGNRPAIQGRPIGQVHREHLLEEAKYTLIFI
jgi:hypothetical protein